MPKGGRAARCPTYMMKRKVHILSWLLVLLMLLTGIAAAEAEDPIVTSIEIKPSKLTGPGKVSVTITVSNSGDQDMTEPVRLYDPAAQVVTDFGTDGAAVLKAGESKTWTGTYDVNQRTLENGSVVYFVKYTLVNANGKSVEKSQPIRAKISLQTAETDIEVKRTISPTIAREGQEVIVRYDITNTGTVSLLDVTIQEHKSIHNKKYTIPELKPGLTAEIKYPVTMGTKDLTSQATVTYKSETQSKKQTYKAEKQIIKYGEPELEAKLTSNVKGVAVNGTVTLTLVLKNTGSVDYSDIRVTDAALGDVFTNQEVKAGKTLELTKEVTVPESMEYQFVITATDATGTETSISTEAVSITAVDPADALTLIVAATPDRTEVFEQPGQVRFTISVTNTSRVDATNVKISHGETNLYTFDTLAAGETRTINRDTALSMPGKYRFTVTAQDPLESTLTFESNEMQIAFSMPTAAPATPTPRPDPTVEPTFVPATVPPKTDASIGTVPKLIQRILLPVLIAAGILLLGSCALLVVAKVQRVKQEKNSKAAVDRLERAKRRDYVTPTAEEELPQPMMEEAAIQTAYGDEEAVLADEDQADYELPHLKYARSAAQTAEWTEEKEDESYSAMNGGYYDEELNPGYDEPGYDMPGYDERGYDESDVTYSAEDGYEYYDDLPMEDPEQVAVKAMEEEEEEMPRRRSRRYHD